MAPVAILVKTFRYESNRQNCYLPPLAFFLLIFILFESYVPCSLQGISFLLAFSDHTDGQGFDFTVS